MPTNVSVILNPSSARNKKKEKKRGPAKTSLNYFWFKAAYAKWYCRVVSSHWNELEIYIFEVIVQVVPFLSLMLLDNWTEFKCQKERPDFFNLLTLSINIHLGKLWWSSKFEFNSKELPSSLDTMIKISFRTRLSAFSVWRRIRHLPIALVQRR